MRAFFFYFLLLLNACSPDENVISYPSGKAIYIENSACIVNADTDTTQEEYDTMIIWCSQFNIHPEHPEL